MKGKLPLMNVFRYVLPTVSLQTVVIRFGVSWDSAYSFYNYVFLKVDYRCHLNVYV
jgi:hypothetical protein